MIFDQPISVGDAVQSVLLKRALAVSPAFGSRDLDKLTPEIRARTFYSARTPYLGYLAEVQTMVGRLVQPDVRVGPSVVAATGPGESISPAQVRAKMKRMLAALDYQPNPAQRGGLLDLSSDKRINLIIDTQLKMARGYGNWRQAQDPTVLDLWPADELYRAMARKERRDWASTWNEARSRLGARTSATLALDPELGPFVALKNDPIWAAISRFGNPYPPFDYMSGMRVRDVDRASAQALGVLGPQAAVQPRETPFAEEVRMDAGNAPAGLLQALRTALGDMARQEGLELVIRPVLGGV